MSGVTVTTGRAVRRPPGALLTMVATVVMTAAGGTLSLAAGTALNWALVGNVGHSLLLGGAGWWLSRSRGGRPVGWLLLGTGTAGALGVLAEGSGTAGFQAGWPGWQVAAWLVLWLWPLYVVPLFTVLPSIFPNGRAPSGNWRWASWLGAGASVLTAVAAAVEPGPLLVGEDAGPPNPLAIAAGGTLMTMAGLMVVAAVLSSLASLGVRWHRAGSTQRQQMKFLWYAMALVLAIELLGGLMPHHVAQAGYFLIPFLLVGAIALSVRRYRLYDIDLVIRRTVVFAALTAVVFAVYLGIVSVLGMAVGPSPGLALIASAAVAGLADPVRRRLQRAVSRFLFGQREEPLEALAGLRQQLRAVADPSEMPATTANAVARALRAEYVSVQLLADGEYGEVARVGVSGVEPSVDVPLEWRGELVGTLTVGPRAPGEAYSRSDLALLNELAYAIGSALHAVRLAEDLRTAQEQAVHAIADERRRLRQDLHDGLGPLLSGIGLAVDGVRRTLSTDSPVAGELRVITDQVRSAATEVRRIIDALPSAAVADLGLTAAIADHLERCAELPGAPLITYYADVDEARVPPAVAEAAYFVLLEAVANVLRHADAVACTLTLSTRCGRLVVQIDDDGVGIGERYVAGVGTASMRRRVGELGGRFELRPRDAEGTTVRAVFPMEGGG
ncbi:sensor histidine kinase [Microtetraspora niveoalba]|uniref:sensor histidine kinase n=1 Tax=Microtetraspora niveoalba TaxID=46175 RepID=UPI00082A2E6C|nr:GAF domain-containing sensor histidine kinase [Microtetraspora niveoalba]